MGGSTLSSNTANSAPWNGRNRTPSKSGPLPASTSAVAITGLPSPTDIQQKAQSRNTLSRHLSSANLSEAAAAAAAAGDRASTVKRRGSTATIASTASSVGRATSQPPDTPRTSNGNLDPPSHTPSSRRRSSIGLGRAPLPRSPSFYGSVSRKSSLAVPQLSTIEGSIADLKQEEARWTGQKPQPRERGPDTSRMHVSPVPDNMKRPALANPEEKETKKVKAVEDAPGQTDVPAGAASGPNKESESEHAGTPAQPSLSEPMRERTISKSSTEGWLSYLTLGKASSRPPSIAPNSNDTADNVTPKLSDKSLSMPTTSEASTEATPSVQQDKDSTPMVHNIAVPNDKRTSRPPSIKSIQNPTKDFSPAIRAESLTPKAVDFAPPAGAAGDSSTESSEGMTRTSSWWFWSSAETAQPVPKTDDIATSTSSGTVAAAESSETQTEKLPAVSTGDPDASAGTSQITVGSETIHAEPVTWSAWLGSYLSRPAGMTTVTYGIGAAPPNTSSAASISASSGVSTVVPEADESFPSAPASPKITTLAEAASGVPRNPLIHAVPASSWSSFFTSRSVYQKRIDSKAADDTGEPEVMEIDFGPAGRDPANSLPPLDSVEATVIQTVSTSVKTKTSSTGGSDDRKGKGAPSTSSQVKFPQDSASAGSSKPVKPLTTDPQSARGRTTSSGSSPRLGPSKPPKPNLVLPSFEDTFNALPRSQAPPRTQHAGSASIKKAAAAGFTWLFASSSSSKQATPSPSAAKDSSKIDLPERAKRLPKALSVVGEGMDLSRAGKVVVIGVHGWFMQSYLKNVVGEPTGTSSKFAAMMKAAVRGYYEERGHPLNDEAVTSITLEGEGTVQERLSKLYSQLIERQEWVDALNQADRVFVAAHSQGCIVSTMLLSRLISEGEVNGTRCSMLLMCGVSQGPFVSLYNSWTSAYLYLETQAARELFEFQKPNSLPSKHYKECMQHVLNAGVKVLLVASLNDQVVPLYSALFSSMSHPSMLRAIFIDAQAFETSADFMTNLVVFATRLRNAGLSPHGLDFHLSEALAGSLMGVGHSTIYDEPQVYTYAVRYALETTGPLLEAAATESPFDYEPFDPRAPTNPFFLPWSLRGILEDQQIRTLFADELSQLRSDFEEWNPKTKPLQQVKLAFEPLRGIPQPKAKDKSQSVPEAAETGKEPARVAGRKSVAKL